MQNKVYPLISSGGGNQKGMHIYDLFGTHKFDPHFAMLFM